MDFGLLGPLVVRDGTRQVPVSAPRQRVLLARRMLEGGADSIELIASRCGFGTAAMLRHHFTREIGTAPSAYRRQFCNQPARTR